MTQDQESRQKALEDQASRTDAEEKELAALNELDERSEELVDAQKALADAVASQPAPTPDPVEAEKAAVVTAQANVDAAQAAVTAAQAPAA